MVARIPYFRFVVAALGSAAVLAFLLNLTLRDWVAALHLAVVLTFTLTTLALAMRALVVAIIDWVRRRRDDPPGRREDFGLAA
jgi:hypothetical protein